MDGIPPTPSEPSHLPRTVLRSEMIEPGDVLLTHGGGWESEIISNLSGGDFSHAALVVNQAMLFESDGGVIGHKAIQWLGWGTIAGEQARLARLLTNPKRWAVYRHSRPRTLADGTFAAALRDEIEHSYGRDYSEMYRLVPLADLPDLLKPLVSAAFQFHERHTLADQIPGPFCSELVSRVYERMGLALFEHGQPAAEISPNHLAKSNLVLVEGAIVSSSSVVAYRPMEKLSNVAERLYPGDHQAHYRRWQRGIERRLDELDKLTLAMRESSRANLALLRSSFQQQIEGAFQLLRDEQARGSEALTRWALRICKDCLEFAPVLASLGEETTSMEDLRVGLQKCNDLGTSYFRCSMNSKSRLLRRSIAARNNPISRFRLRRTRLKILKTAREFLRTRSQMRTFVGEILAPPA